MERDVEAILDSLYDAVFVGVMIASINYAYGFWPALLGCPDGCP